MEPETVLPAAPPRIQSAASGPDARQAATGESSEWFRQLPAEMQDEYRRRWRANEDRDVRRASYFRRTWKRGVVRGAGTFLVVHAMFGFGGPVGLAVATLIGALTGVVWTVLDAGPMKTALVTAPLYAGVWLAFTPSVALFPMLCFATLVAMGVGGALGQSREFQQGDGFE